MSTYTDLHNCIKENVSVIRRPHHCDDGMTPQLVKFMNPSNIYNGTFIGKISSNYDAKIEELSNGLQNFGQLLSDFDGTLSGFGQTLADASCSYQLFTDHDGYDDSLSIITRIKQENGKIQISAAPVEETKISTMIHDAVSGLTGEIDLKDYAKKTDLSSLKREFLSSLDGYATKDDLSNFITEDDLTGYATKNELKSYAKTSDLSAFATKDDLSNFITEDDLTGYATKNELKSYAKTSDLSTFATKDDLSNFITEDDLSGYATKDSVTTLKQEFDEFNANISEELGKQLSSLSGYLSNDVESDILNCTLVQVLTPMYKMLSSIYACYRK